MKPVSTLLKNESHERGVLIATVSNACRFAVWDRVYLNLRVPVQRTVMETMITMLAAQVWKQEHLSREQSP